MHRSCLLVAVTVAIVAGSSGRQAWGFATEAFGNEPLSELNYAAWKGIMPLVNDKARVYETWANGNERLYYKGTTKELNQALAHFAKMDVEHHVVVLRPGPAVKPSFEKKKIPYNWELHVIGGLARRHATSNIEELEWLKDPVLTVYVGGDIVLDKIDIPKTVTVVAGKDEGKSDGEVQKKIAEFVEVSKREIQK
jgi:hypothetical protein